MYSGSTLDLRLHPLHEKMQIHVVETLTGRAMNLAITSSDTVNNVKAKIQHEHGFPMDQQCLIYANRQLDNNEGNSTLVSVKHPQRCPSSPRPPRPVSEWEDEHLDEEVTRKIL